MDDEVPKGSAEVEGLQHRVCVAEVRISEPSSNRSVGLQRTKYFQTTSYSLLSIRAHDSTQLRRTFSSPNCFASARESVENCCAGLRESTAGDGCCWAGTAKDIHLDIAIAHCPAGAVEESGCDGGRGRLADVVDDEERNKME